jgi:proteic killer suppression protein
MIRSFADQEIEKVFARRHSRRYDAFERVALRKLRQIHRASGLDDLKAPPGNRLEMLKRDRSGQWSIRIHEQWRICFEWRDGDAYQVEIVDYH